MTSKGQAWSMLAGFGVNGEGDAHGADSQFRRLLPPGEFAPQDIR